MYVITAATGNTGKELTHALLAAGKPVKVISRSAEKVADLVAAGAVAAIGDIMDTEFLTHAFTDATAVYLLTPPNWAAADWRTFQVQVAASYVTALHHAKVPYVVHLSSQGAHLAEGAGPVSGLFYLETMLNSIKGLNVKHLRPGFFMQNFYGFLGMIKHMGIFGQSLKGDLKMPVVHTRDIAAVAAKHLLALDFEGNSVQFIGGPADRPMRELTAVIGAAVGKPELPYLEFSREDEYNGMVQNGIPHTVAAGYGDLFNALNNGGYQNGYVRTTDVTTPTTFEDFIQNEWIHAYRQA